MSTVLTILEQLNLIILKSDSVTEDGTRVNISGSQMDSETRSLLISFYTLCQPIEPPTILVDGTASGIHDLEDEDLVSNEPWRLIFPKPRYTDCLEATGREDNVILFTSEERLTDWVKRYDPFDYSNDAECDLSVPTTIRVMGLLEGFGSHSLWILPLSGDAHVSSPSKPLPTDSEVNKLIHINCTTPKKVCPAAFGLVWGSFSSDVAQAFISLGVNVLAASLAQELRCEDKKYQVALKGTKKIALELSREGDMADKNVLSTLVDAVSWLYEERPETRQQLIIDRLSIDVDVDQSFVYGLQQYLDTALEQAKDSYDFVILERKDAYHKEMRELMKDMTAQANLYASKVRELVNAVSRDFLGILVFLSFSYLARVNNVNMDKLLASDGLNLLGQVLAVYLAISCILQLIIHYKDAKMSYDEAADWTEALRHYTSREEKKERFLNPIKKRRKLLYMAMGVTMLLYLILIVSAWNVSGLLREFIADPKPETEQIIKPQGQQGSMSLQGENKVVIRYIEN